MYRLAVGWEAEVSRVWSRRIERLEEGGEQLLGEDRQRVACPFRVVVGRGPRLVRGGRVVGPFQAGREGKEALASQVVADPSEAHQGKAACHSEAVARQVEAHLPEEEQHTSAVRRIPSVHQQP